MEEPKFFITKLERFPGRGTWIYADVPIDVENEFGTKGRLRVKASINGKEVITSLMPHGNGKHFIILSKEIRSMVNIELGDTIEVSLEKENSPNEVTIPTDLLDALKKNKKAHDYFKHLPPSHKKEYIKWIDEAKKMETRNSRILKTVEKLAVELKLK